MRSPFFPSLYTWIKMKLKRSTFGNLCMKYLCLAHIWSHHHLSFISPSFFFEIMCSRIQSKMMSKMYLSRNNLMSLYFWWDDILKSKTWLSMLRITQWLALECNNIQSKYIICKLCVSVKYIIWNFYFWFVFSIKEVF